MISELSGDSRQGRRGDKSKHRSELSGLQKKVVDSLVYRYLCEKGCDYTVGVFLPEVNLSKSEVCILMGHVNNIPSIFCWNFQKYSVKTMYAIID